MQLPNEDKRMKGFNWNPDDKPKSPLDITSLSIRPSERKSYDNRPRASFRYTNSYFPGYIDEIYHQIEVRDSLDRVRRIEAEQARKRAETDSLAAGQTDTLATVPADSLAKEKALVSPDSLSTSITAPADSLKPKPNQKSKQTDSLSTVKRPTEKIADSLNVKTDTVAPADTTTDDTLIPRDKWEERYLKKVERNKQREAKWAELDARDAEKAAAKAAKKLEKQRAKTRKLLEIEEKQAAKNQKRLDRYIKQMEKQKARRPQPQTGTTGSE